MNKFLNFGRLCRLARLQLTLNYRRILLFGLGYILLISTLYLMFNLGYISGSIDRASNGMFIAGRVMSCMLTFFLFSYVISCSFRPYFKRGFAAANMMLPATRCEKFIMALVPSLVIAPILLCVITLANDSLWIWILGPIESSYPDMVANGDVTMVVRPMKSLFAELIDLNSLEHLVGTNNEDKIAITRLLFWAMMIVPTVIFFMFSSIYRRLTLLLSIISMGVGNMIVVAISQLVILQFLIDDINVKAVFVSDNNAYIVVLIVLIAISLTVLYISWLRFSRLQINK